jgi:hypothetical protein
MSLDVLNCKLGDLKFSFDKSNPVELERARRAVMRMMLDGFVLFVEVDGQLRRVDAFDSASDCYVITDVPSEPALAVPAITPQALTSTPTSTVEPDHAGDDDGNQEPSKPTGKRGRPAGKQSSKRKLPADKHRATSIAPRSGG